jgi:hypothetical protein
MSISSMVLSIFHPVFIQKKLIRDTYAKKSISIVEFGARSREQGGRLRTAFTHISELRCSCDGVG